MEHEFFVADLLHIKPSGASAWDGLSFKNLRLAKRQGCNMPLHPFAPQLCTDSALASCIMAAMPLLQGKSFLEVGCGNGYFCGYAHSRYATPVVGIDQNPQAILDAKLHFPFCDFRTTPLLPPDRFDVVLARATVPEAKDEFQLYLSHLMARLRPGGLLLFSVPSFSPSVPQNSYREFTQRLPTCDWRKEGTAAGYTLISIRHRTPSFSLPPAACLQPAQRFTA